MNKVILLGRMTKDAELKSTANGVSVCSFSLAVQRRFKNAEGNYEADFINCVAWRQQADFISKYFGRGSLIAIVGSIQTRTYEGTDGKKVYVTEVVVEEAHFAGEKKKDESPAAPSLPEGFMPTMDGDLPF